MINLSALKMDNLNPGHGHLKLELCLCLIEGETTCTLTCRMDLNKLPCPEQVLTVHLLNLHPREGVSILSLTSMQTRDPTPHSTDVLSNCTQPEHFVMHVKLFCLENARNQEKHLIY